MPSALVRCRSILGTGSAALLLLLAAGCGESRKSVYPVHGQVLDSEGKPAAGAKVIFHPVDDPDPRVARPLGTVDDSGSFVLTTYDKGDGAPAGEYAVTIEWRPNASTFNKMPADKLKGRFADHRKTPFKATVGKQATTLEPFRLD